MVVVVVVDVETVVVIVVVIVVVEVEVNPVVVREVVAVVTVVDVETDSVNENIGGNICIEERRSQMKLIIVCQDDGWQQVGWTDNPSDDRRM